ncbi:hypothetical protein EVAR_58010_1 [Eumeta japonica]|uniref:Uncharacterized protein n=1 Tax=Eumeta variegata TaxID=151549 RepID=A0A4C1YBC0_EUMVA|nr:hypothetical protein EVAR_58010_1 [Eumeta japonica]
MNILVIIDAYKGRFSHIACIFRTRWQRLLRTRSARKNSSGRPTTHMDHFTEGEARRKTRYEYIRGARAQAPLAATPIHTAAAFGEIDTRRSACGHWMRSLQRFR